MKKSNELFGNAKIPELKKFLRLMKLIIFFILISVGCVLAGKTYSQIKTFTLHMENSTVKEVLAEIEGQSEFRIMYSGKFVDVDRKVSVNVENQKIETVLNILFAGTDVGYTVRDRFIVLITPELMNEGTLAVTQQRAVSGKVTDSGGQPLPGVTVVVKGTTQGTVTNADGNYSLTNILEDATLVFSFVGMRTQEVAVSDQATVNVTMEEDVIGIEEVVAIGYGTMKKSDLTGAIATVSTKDFNKVPASTPLQILQGRASGIQITTNTGMPGSGSSVLIRGVHSINGTNSPIYVVDGVIRNSIDNLNPNSIEMVSILKDASAAAIYGARAANGVVLVTTKRGAGKTDIEISLDAYLGIQTESNLKLNLLNADQYLELFTEAYQNAGLDLPWNDEILSYYQGVDTDWKDLIMQKGAIQNYDLSITGGSKKSNYYISTTFQDTKGMIIETGYKKYTLTFNSDHKINDWIKFGNSLNIFADQREGTMRRGGLDSEPYEVALRKVPITRAYEADGDYGIIYNTSLEHMNANPVWMAKEYVNEQEGKGLMGNMYLTLELLKGLEFTAQGSMDYSKSYATFFKPSLARHYGWEGSVTNLVEKRHSETIHWVSDFLLNYNTTIRDNHNIRVLLGYSLEESIYEYLSGSRTGTPNNEIRFLNAGDPVSQLNENGFTDWAFTSVFSRLNYAFKNKYLFTATIRRDGTSRLIESNRYGVFPSVSVAWRASEEGFLNDVDFIDDLRLRASYGTLGNILSVGAYGTSASLNSRRAVLNDQPATAYTLTSAVNSDIKWESALKRNVGIDATLLNNRLYTTIDYFIENTYDLLFSNPIPISTGLSGQPLINAGEVRNTGYEIEVGYRGQKSDWMYDVSFNLSHVKNEVIDLDGRNLRTSGLLEGYPVRSYFGYMTNGIIYNESQLDIYKEGSFKQKTVGDVYLLDIDGYDSTGNLTGIPDGKVDAADRTLIGKRYPDFIYGALGTVGYKNWSLQVQLQGVQGIDIRYDPGNWNGVLKLMTSTPRNEDARILDRYHPSKNPTGEWPRLSVNDSGQNIIFSEFWLEDASYLRVRNINLNYSLPTRLSSKIGMKGLGLYMSVQNAYTFTKFTGPEVDIADDPLTGVSQPRTWTLGLKATF